MWHMFSLKKNNIFWFVLILIVLTPALYGIFHKGFFVSDDGNWMVIRFSAFYQALREGQFPVRFLARLNNGYGYPVANFLYPGFLYLGVPLKAIGFNSLEVIKILMAFFMGSGIFFSFLWLRKFFDSYSSFIGAFVYTYLPYHLYNLYTRGSVGELMSLGVVPYTLWSIERRSYFLTAIGIFLLLISHNTLALLFLVVIFLYIFTRRFIRWAIPPIITGFFLSAFFTIPALYDLKFTKFAATEISNPLNHFAKLPLIGFVCLAILFLSGVSFFGSKARKHVSIAKNLEFLFIVLLVLSVILAGSISLVFWEVFPSLWIQFPFRFLSISIISTAFLTSYVIYHFIPRLRIFVGVCILIITFSFSLGFLFPQEYDKNEIGFYDTNESLTTTHDEYMPKTVKSTQQIRVDNIVEVASGEMVIEDVKSDTNQIYFKTLAKTNGVIKINRVYFPGWNVSIDNGKKIVPYTKDDGFMYVAILRGSHVVNATFSETPVRSIADALSLVGVFLLLLPLGRAMHYKFFK